MTSPKACFIFYVLVRSYEKTRWFPHLSACCRDCQSAVFLLFCPVSGCVLSRNANPVLIASLPGAVLKTGVVVDRQGSTQGTYLFVSRVPMAAPLLLSRWLFLGGAACARLTDKAAATARVPTMVSAVGLLCQPWRWGQGMRLPTAAGRTRVRFRAPRVDCVDEGRTKPEQGSTTVLSAKGHPSYANC